MCCKLLGRLKVDRVLEEAVSMTDLHTFEPKLMPCHEVTARTPRRQLRGRRVVRPHSELRPCWGGRLTALPQFSVVSNGCYGVCGRDCRWTRRTMNHRRQLFTGVNHVVSSGTNVSPPLSSLPPGKDLPEFNIAILGTLGVGKSGITHLYHRKILNNEYKRELMIWRVTKDIQSVAL